jgi:ribosomal protein S18 acetylase RimI-like enzyme
MNIRPLNAHDIPALQTVLEETGLFPAELLPELVSGFLTDQQGNDLWLTCEDGGRAIGFCYAAPEPLTEATWNMRAIAVLPSRQGTGVGAALVEELEASLIALGQRILIVDTSGTAAFDRTRQFYRSNRYVEEARIRDFWASGDDKVIFRKAL